MVVPCLQYNIQVSWVMCHASSRSSAQIYGTPFRHAPLHLAVLDDDHNGTVGQVVIASRACRVTEVLGDNRQHQSTTSCADNALCSFRVIVENMVLCVGKYIMIVPSKKEGKKHVLRLTGLGSRLVLEIPVIQACEVPNNAISYSNVSMSMLNKVDFVVNADLNVSRGASSLREVHVELTKCREAVSSSTCEYFQTWRFKDKLCSEWNDPSKPWSEMLRCIEPRPDCPIKEGVYRIRNGTMDLKVLQALPIPLEGSVWMPVLSFSLCHDLHFPRKHGHGLEGQGRPATSPGLSCPQIMSQGTALHHPSPLFPTMPPRVNLSHPSRAVSVLSTFGSNHPAQIRSPQMGQAMAITRSGFKSYFPLRGRVDSGSR
ncbi:Guanylate kinase [Frankliniella fusca]|uniref:Guanylate kinase n=1 Tax=Frankliniella fusca TaxID=407009 RepID=A0AAE1LDW4_9NEOP|nr:Guanylate kinase [Frankliniella fusca]